ncbi:hypothetical protein JCM11251_007681 [Rhodosporidiobolus azoricus]
MLSSLSGSISTYFRQNTAREGHEEHVSAHEEYGEQGEGQAVSASPSTPSPPPHTPEHPSSTQRLSPNSLSASGSEIITGVLSAHPHFSVFRKRSGEQTSREEQVDDSPSGTGHSGGFCVRDLQDEEEAVETLVTPPNESPTSSAKNPSAADANTSSDSSFHLSLDSGDMPSLNFGEASSLSLSPASSPSGPFPRSRSSSPSYAPRTASPLSAVHTPDGSTSLSGGGVRLVPDSPPQTRTPARQSQSNTHSFSRSSSTDTLDRSERRKMRSSTGTGPVQRVQFSPLSLCPSPLMSAPPPPPPPPPAFSLDEDALTPFGTPPATTTTTGGKGILKLPKTPGTGRSVRFSASTVRRSPLVETVGLPAGGRDGEDEEEGEEGMEDSPSVVPGSRSLSRFSRSQIEVEESHEASAESAEGQVSVTMKQVEGDRIESDQVEEDQDTLHHSSLSDFPAPAPFIEGDSSLLISSTLLSRLQAIAPSPDVSLVSPPTALASLPAISIGQATPSTSSGPQVQTQGQDPSLLLFDESNPFLGQSHSQLHSQSHLDSVTLATSTASSTAHFENGGTSASVLLIDSSLPHNLVEASLAAVHGGGGPSFGGESFAQVSYLHQQHRQQQLRPGTTPRAGQTRLEEIGEEEEDVSFGASSATADYSAATTVLPPPSLASPARSSSSFVAADTSRTPRRPPSRSRSRSASPHSSCPQTPSAAARDLSLEQHGSPLRASDMSSVAPGLEEEDDAEQQEEEEQEQPERRTRMGTASLSPPPGYDSLSPPTSGAATFSPASSSPAPCNAPTPPSAACPPASTPTQAKLGATTSHTNTNANAGSSTSTGADTGPNLSFYRRFMSSRASHGGSSTAREEWERLERGEKGSPKDSHRDSVHAGLGSTSSRASAGAGVGGSGISEEGEGWEETDLEAQEQQGEVQVEVEVEGESVYYSPRKEVSVEDEHEEDGGGCVRGGGSEEEVGMDGLERMRASFLSPIIELSEPESTANTPFDPSSASTTSHRRPTSAAPLPPQPSFASALQQSLSASATAAPAPPATPSRKLSSSRAPSTPLSASKIPRPRNPITPSQNPFLLQLARAPHPAGSRAGEASQKGAALLTDLFSAQQDQLATSHSQRFILSSLVTNLQNEVEHKEKMVDNLKRQVEQAREEAREVEQLALDWEERFRQATTSFSPAASFAPTTDTPSASSRHDRKKILALEETIQLLADELETRVQEDRAHRHRLEVELDETRADLMQRVRDVKEGEIRLRYAQEEALRAVEEGRRAREEEGSAKEEVEGLRARWAVEVEERDTAVRQLRDELLDLKQHGTSQPADEADIEKEVARRVAVALEELARETALVKHEVVQRDAALASLRDSSRQQRDEIDRLAYAVQTERQQAELAHTDLTAALEAREEELLQAQEGQVAAQEEADEALVRLESAEIERDRMGDAVRTKEEQLAQQVEQNASALEAMAELETHVQRIESDLAAKADGLRRVRKEMEQQKREAEDVLEKRDRVLAETEKAAGRAKRELEQVQKENNRLNDLVGKLRRDSADREVKITKLKKRAAELEEDVFGLNIALDAKQQEASHWKRQMSTLKHDRERSAAAASSLAESTTSVTFPSTVSRSAFAPVTAASTVRRSTSTTSILTATTKVKQHATTPHPIDKTKSAASRRFSAAPRSSATAISTSSATETEDDDVEASHDLTLPPADYEKTPSRAPYGGIRKSSTVAALPSVGTGMLRSRSSASFSSGRSSVQEGEAKENAPPSYGREGRRREAVLA